MTGDLNHEDYKQYNIIRVDIFNGVVEIIYEEEELLMKINRGKPI